MERKWRLLSKKALSPEEGRSRRELRKSIARKIPRSKDGFCIAGGVFMKDHLTEKDKKLPG